MRRTSFLAVGFVLATGLLEPCTVFKATVDGRTLVGNNEDWEDVPTRIWVLPPEEDAYGMILFGFVNGWAQGGMNDRGLIFDWVAGFETGWARSPDLPDYFENISEKILAESSTVEEAVALSAAFNVEGFSAARMVVVDRSGDSAVVGFEDGKFRIWRGHQNLQTIGVNAATAEKMLRENRRHSIGDFAEILAACRLQGRFRTRYSTVYDPGEGKVVVYGLEGFDRGVDLILAKEFEKGSHYYDLERAGEQRDQPSRVDHKTVPAVAVSPAAATAVGGMYRGRSASLREVRIGVADGGLYLWPVADGARRFRIEAVSEDVFVLRSFAGTFTVARDSTGGISGLVMDQAGREHVLERIGDSLK